MIDIDHDQSIIDLKTSDLLYDQPMIDYGQSLVYQINNIMLSITDWPNWLTIKKKKKDL